MTYPYVRPALGLVAGGEYQPITIAPEAPGAVFGPGDFLISVTTGTITLPAAIGSLATFLPTSVPTIGYTARSGEATHSLFWWYALFNASDTLAVDSSQLYYGGVVTNPPGYSATITVPADGNYPSKADHFALYVGTLPSQPWLQVASTALGSAAEIPAWPLTNNIGVNRAGNDPSSGIVGYANYPSQTGYAQAPGFFAGAGFNWRSLFGIDQGLSGSQTLYEQYAASITKLQNVPVTISLLQPWAGQIGATAGIVFNVAQQVFYLDTAQSNKIFVIDRGPTGIPGPYNPVGQLGDVGVPVVGHFIGGLA